MYSPAEINKAYRLKTSIIYMVPSLVVILLVLYYPPKMILSFTGTLQGVQLQEIADSLQDAKLQLQRNHLQLQNLQLQLQNCKKQENAIIAIAGDGIKLQLQKPQFQTWAEWSAANPSKKFSDFREVENAYLKSEIEKIWEQIRKEAGNE